MQLYMKANNMERFKNFFTKDKNNGIVPNYVHGKHASLKDFINESDEHIGIENYEHKNKEFVSAEHMDNTLGAHYDKHVAEHPDVKHVKAYTDESEINNRLLAQHNYGGKLRPEHEEMAAGLDRILASKPSAQEHHTYSGLGYDPRRHVDESGHMYSPGYTSSSPDVNVAKRFAKDINNKTGDRAFSNNKDTSTKHILKIKIPKGSTHGLYINGSSKFGRGVAKAGLDDEKEMLLKRNIKYKVNPTPTIIKNGEGKVTHMIHHADIVE